GGGAGAGRSLGARPAGVVDRARLPGLAPDRHAPPRGRQVRRAARTAMKKLVVAVIDGLKPSMLERAVAEGSAPVLEHLMREGTYVDDCVAAYPSLTPVCTATIATGEGADRHLIPGMNWF